MAEAATAIGCNLKRLRKAAGLTQQALATAAGLSVSIVAMIEQGANTDPRVSTIRALARVIGCTAADLLDEQAVPPAPRRGRRKPRGGGE